MATAVAGEMIGMKCIFLDAGSGATTPISSEIISSVSKTCKAPIIVGGGISSTKEIKNAHDAGADLVIIGNHIEKNPNFLSEL